jgi:hypothetical protein
MDWSKVERAAHERGMVVSNSLNQGGDVWVGYPGTRGPGSFMGRVLVTRDPAAAMTWLALFPVVQSGRA